MTRFQQITWYRTATTAIPLSALAASGKVANVELSQNTRCSYKRNKCLVAFDQNHHIYGHCIKSNCIGIYLVYIEYSNISGLY